MVGDAEAAVGDQRAVEPAAQLLDELTGRLRVQHAEVGEAQGAQAVDQGAVGGADVGRSVSSASWTLCSGEMRMPTLPAPIASATAVATSTTKRARFSGLPPYWSVRWLDAGREELVQQVAVGAVDLDAVQAGGDRPLASAATRSASVARASSVVSACGTG